MDDLYKELKAFTANQGIILKNQNDIVLEAIETVKLSHKYSLKEVKENFDSILPETEKVAYEIYKREEAKYGKKFMVAFIEFLKQKGEVKKLEDVAPALGKHFHVLDQLYLSIAQSRKVRAGKSFEVLHNSLFKILGYPFDEQKVIEGKPDFVMPSVDYYKKNAMQSIVFTAKRTLRERWRQIVTEGTRGIGFFLATIDEDLSKGALLEMKGHKIFVVCPKAIKMAKYPDVVNVISFERFFEDHLDPKMKIWKRDGVI